MEVPYRLDNIKVVMGSDDSEANILSKITLLPYDKSSTFCLKLQPDTQPLSWILVVKQT